MKKNKFWYVLVGLFCLCTSGVTVYAASHSTETPVGVGFVDPDSSSEPLGSGTPSSSTDSSTSSSYSATTESDSSLPDTNRKSGFTWWRNDGGGSGGTYYSDSKRLPSTGELVHLALPFAGVFLIMLVFFYLKRERRKAHE